MREQLRKSGAILYVISTVGAQRAAPSQARQGISTEQAQLHDDEAVESAHNLGLVLGDGSRESGGRHEQVISTTLIPTLEQLADELLNQYVLTCLLPDGVETDRQALGLVEAEGRYGPRPIAASGFVLIPNLIPGPKWPYSTSRMASTSTGALPGRAAMPTADRACFHSPRRTPLP